MGGKKANSVTSLDRLFPSSFQYCTLSLPEKALFISLFHFPLLRPRTHSRKFIAAVSSDMIECESEGGGTMQGLKLIKNLAELDRELAEKVEETRRSADLRIKSAEAESQRLLAEAEAQIRRMEKESRTQIAAASARLAEDARQRAAAEQERLREPGRAKPRPGRGIYSLRGHAVIARMEKVFIVGPKRLAPKILFMVQQAGVVQVDSLPRDQLGAYQLEAEAETRLRRWEAVALAVDHASGLLGLDIDAPVEPFLGDLAEAEATVSSCEQRAATLVEKRERLIDELNLIGQYHEVLEHLAAAVQGLDVSPRLSVIPFLVERRDDLTASEQKLTVSARWPFSPH